MVQEVKMDRLRKALLENEADIRKSLSSRVKFEHLVDSAHAAYVAGDDRLRQANLPSLVAAVKAAGMMGLTFDKALGHISLQSRGGSASLNVGYQGAIELMTRDGAVLSVDPQIVYENDDFTYRLGTDPMIEHSPKLDGDRGKRLCAYTVLWLPSPNGIIKKIELTDRETIEKAYAKAPCKNVWKEHPDPMWRKTSVLRAAKYVPKSAELAQAINYEERLERDELGDDGLVGKDTPPESTTNGLAAAAGVTEPEQPEPDREELKDKARAAFAALRDARIAAGETKADALAGTTRDFLDLLGYGDESDIGLDEAMDKADAKTLTELIDKATVLTDELSAAKA